MTTPSLRDVIDQAECLSPPPGWISSVHLVCTGLPVKHPECAAAAARSWMAEHLQPWGSWLTILNDDGSYHCNHGPNAECPLPDHTTEPTYRLSPALADALSDRSV